jgi:hypothetical protein
MRVAHNGCKSRRRSIGGRPQNGFKLSRWSVQKKFLRFVIGAHARACSLAEVRARRALRG